MSLLSNFGNRSGGGPSSGGLRIIEAAGSNQKSALEVEEEARVERRFKLLVEELPVLGYSQSSLLVDLAKQQTDDDDMMRAAIGAMSAVEIQNTIDMLKVLPEEQQRGMAELMSPVKRSALESNGWSVPDEKKGGFWNTVKSGTFSVAGAGMKGLGWGMRLPLIKETLGAMDYVAEEAGRINRVAPQSQSGKDLLAQTGMTQDELFRQTGIATPGADIESNLMDTGFGVGSLINSVLHGEIPEAAKFASRPSDLWKAVQVWDSVGHEGDDDILPQTQYEVFNDLEAEFAGQGKDMLRWAKAVSAGETLEDLAESEGLQGDDAARFVQAVGLLSESGTFRKAVSRLESGRMSLGRNVARLLYDNPTLDTREGGARVVSGTFDAVYSVAADPTIAVGKAVKVTKAVRWGVKGAEGAEKLDRWQHLTKLLLEAEKADDITDVARRMREVGGGNRFLTGVVHEAEMVAAPAKAVAKAFDTGDFATLTRQYPGFMRSIDDMMRYNDDLVAKGLPGFADDASQVFEFYKHAAYDRSVIGVGDQKFSTKIFGHDGGGHLLVPHMTSTQKARLAASQAFQSTVLGRKTATITDDVARDLKEAADEAAADLAKERGVPEEEIAELADKMEIDKWTGAYQVKQPNWIQSKLDQIYASLSESTVKKGYVPLEGELSAQEFKALNESIGIIGRVSPAERAIRFNRFVGGSTAERHSLVNEMIGKMADAANLTATAEGRSLIRKYMEHSNHVYGIGDELSAELPGSSKRLVSRQAILEEQLANGIQVPSMKEMLIASREATWTRFATGTIRKSVLEAAMNRVWKPGVIMRFGFPLRAAADELIQDVMRNSLTDYLRVAVVEKWAGISNMAFDPKTGRMIRNPRAAMRPMRTLTRGMATIAGGTDEAIRTRALQRLAQDADFIAAEPVARKAMEEAAVKSATRKDLRWVPMAFRTVADYHELAALRSSEAFRAVTRTKYLTREHWANWLLEHSDNYQATLRNRQIAGIHPFFQQEMAETLGNSFHGLRPGESNSGLSSMAILKSDASPSGYQALPLVTDRGNFQWVGHDDISGSYLNLSKWMESMNQSPSSRAAMRELVHHVPQKVMDDIAGLGVEGLQGVDLLKSLRDDVARNPEIRKTLTQAVNTEASADTIRQVLKANSVEGIEEYEDLLRAWDGLSPDARFFLVDNTLVTDRLHTDWNVIQDRAANATYNAFRKLDGQDNLRSLMRAQLVDGKPVAEGLKRNHVRVYAPMIDRRSAEEIVRMFQDPDLATSFAERLREHLMERNLFGEMDHIWRGAPPSANGFDLATWMAGLKASMVQGDGNYITAMMAGSSNYAAAEAMRDALADVLPETMLRPTVGYYDYAKDLLDTRDGIHQLSESTVGMEPYHAVKMRPIDPDNVVRQVHVELANNKKMWVGQDELDNLGRAARMDEVEAEQVFQSAGLTEVNRQKGTVRFHSDLIDQDYRAGMKFLRGEAGDFERVKAKWVWADREYAGKAEEMGSILEQMGLADNSGLVLDDMVGLYRTRHLRNGAPLPLEGMMHDAEVWNDFVELAESATTDGKRVVEAWHDQRTAVQSRLAKRALDDLVPDLDELNLTRSQYKKLLIEREKAHIALDPAGFGRPSAATREALEREKDALAIAFQRAGIDVGDSVTDRIKVAMGKEKSDYRILGEIWGTGTTEDAAVRRAAQQVLEEVNGVFVGRQSGEVLHGVLAPVLRGEHELPDLIRKVSADDLPTKAFGPSRVVAGGLSDRYDQFLNRAFQGAYEPIIGAMSRTPMSHKAFDKAMETLEPVYANHIHRGLDDAAKGILAKIDVDPGDLEDVHDLLFRQLKNDPDFGQDILDPITDYARNLAKGELDEARKSLGEVLGRRVDLSDDEMETLANWHRNLSEARDAQVHKATQRMLDMVTPYIDDHRIRSNFQEFIGPVFLPFYYAEEMFLRRFARGLYETPYMLRKGQLTMNGLRNLGIIRQDPYGNEIIVIPGSELLTGAVADVATLVTGNEAFQVLDQPLSMRTEFALPGWSTEQSRWGWGPIIGLSTDKMLARYPEAEWRSEPTNRKWWEYVIPGPAAGAYKAFLQDGDPAQIASAQMAAMSYLEANGHGLPENATASQKEHYLEKVRQVTKVAGVLRYISGQLSFTATVPIDQEAMMRKEFTDLLAKGLNYEDALDTFIADNGPDAIVYTIFGTQNETGAPLPTTEAAWRFMLENEDMLRDNPTAMAWLIPQETTDSKFDRRAYNEQLAIGLRSRKADVDVLDQIYVKQSAETYFELKDIHDATRRGLVARRDGLKGPAREAVQDQIRAEDDRWEAEKKSYLAMHPVFEESLTSAGSDRRKETIENLEWIIAAGMGGEQAEEIEPLLTDYIAFRDQHSALADQSSKAAKKIKEDMLTDYFDKQWLYVQSHPKAQVFWNSVIRPELPDQADTIEAEKMTPVGA